VVLGEPPNENAPYTEWLAFQKRKWRIQRAERKRRRLMGISALTSRAEGRGTVRAATAAPGGMAAFLNTTAQRTNMMHWQIIQICESPEPGLMRAWCMVGGDLHCMRVNVPRRFYINSRTPDQASSWPRVTRHLPRSQPCLNLYEVTMTEREFRDKQRQLTSRYALPIFVGFQLARVCPGIRSTFLSYSWPCLVLPPFIFAGFHMPMWRACTS
jgi:DNA polymerase epsilon subunit 1